MHLLIMFAGAYQLTRWIMSLVERIEKGGNHAHTKTAQGRRRKMWFPSKS